jgi:hypothetical protein
VGAFKFTSTHSLTVVARLPHGWVGRMAGWSCSRIVFVLFSQDFFTLMNPYYVS